MSCDCHHLAQAQIENVSNIPSSAFYWPKRVMSPAENHGAEKRAPPLAGAKEKRGKAIFQSSAVKILKVHGIG